MCSALLCSVAHRHGALSAITEAMRAMRCAADRLTVKLPVSLDHKSATVKLGSSDNSVINKNWGVAYLRSK